MPSTKPFSSVRSPTVRLKLHSSPGATAEPLISSAARPMLVMRYGAGSNSTVKEDISSTMPRSR